MENEDVAKNTVLPDTKEMIEEFVQELDFKGVVEEASRIPIDELKSHDTATSKKTKMQKLRIR